MRNPANKGQESNDAMVVQRVAVGVRHYELRYNRCGKESCTVCYHRQADYAGRPGHGPYWYLSVARGRKWVRLYIGKELDTVKYIGGDGEIDWSLVKKKKVGSKASRAAAPEDQ